MSRIGGTRGRLQTRMQLLAAVLAIVAAAVLFTASVLVDNWSKDSKVSTNHACVAKEQARIASPYDFNSDPCFQWDGAACRKGEVTLQGCAIHSPLLQKALLNLSMVSLSVGIVLFFVPTRDELERPRKHHR